MEQEPTIQPEEPVQLQSAPAGHPWSYLVTAMVVVAALVVGFLAIPQQHKVGSRLSIAKKAPLAFGDLKGTQGSESRMTSFEKATGSLATDKLSADSMMPASDAGSDSSMYYSGAAKYTYTGPAFTMPASADVYRKASSPISSNDLAALASRFGFPKMSLGGVDYQLKSLSLASADGKESMVYSSDTGSISYFRNYVYQASAQAVREGAVQPEQATLSDEEGMKVVNEFLNARSISTRGFDVPVVQKDSAAWYGYSGEFVVVYPLSLGGVPVYTQDGRLYGLRVSVAAATKEVFSIENLQTLQFESSSYPLVTDPQKVIDQLEDSVGYSVYGMPVSIEEGGNPSKKEISITSARFVYVQQWRFQDAGVEVFFSPAIAFEIPEADQASVYARAILVPITQDYFDSLESQVIPPIEPATGSGTVSSESVTAEPVPAPEMTTLEAQ